MLRHGLVVLAGALALWAVLGFVLPLFASDETRIRLLLADACEAYDEAAAGDVAAVFAPEWRDKRSGGGRADLRDALLARFVTERDPLTRAWPERARIDKRSFAVDIDEAAGTAEASFEFELLRLRKEGERVLWRATVELGLEERPEGWRVVATDWATLEGRPY